MKLRLKRFRQLQGSTISPFTVSDGSLSAEQAFTVTIDGVNDQTVLTSVNSTAVSTVVSELAGDSSAQDIAAIHGSLAFTDEDIGDNLTASASLPSVLINGNPLSSKLSDAAADALTTALNDLRVGAGVISTGGTQTISWTWDPTPANLDFLKAGDQLTITYAMHVGDFCLPEPRLRHHRRQRPDGADLGQQHCGLHRGVRVGRRFLGAGYCRDPRIARFH